MVPALHVASPPAKPLMLFDGECGFCALWVRRWHRTTGDRVDYLPYQDPAVLTRFPELSRESLEAAVHLVELDGSVYRGAAAAFRALAMDPHERWLLDLYIHHPVFEWISEKSYNFIARHRRFFSFLTRLLWGAHIETPSYTLVRRVFLRSLGLIYLIAFLSLWVQVSGLIGVNGILPAQLTMEAARAQSDAAHIGWNRYHLLPTLCWLGASDAFLKAQCAAGVVLALLVIIGLAPAPCLFLLWLIYLSLTTVGRDFLSFQWDNLLLEVGLLAIFFALRGSAGVSPAVRAVGFSELAGETPALPGPSKTILWLLRWLVFRLMFASGCIKLLSGDPTWRNLTALTFHYETQPLPTWLGWYAHQLPIGLQKASNAAMFGVELIFPFLIFAPRRPRQLACISFIALQVLIFLTGNYCFFNLLSIALCLTLLDDAALRSLIPSKWRSLGSRRPKLATLPPEPGPTPSSPNEPSPSSTFNFQPSTFNYSRLRFLNLPLVLLIAAISLMEFAAMFRLPIPWPRPFLSLYGWMEPFRSINHYGLFAVMTTSRLEISVEGSNDGLDWREYEFKYKTGPVNRRPRFVEPHQPRLDWQMWFAALGTYRQNAWFVNFCARLLQGSPEVLGLLERNPFPNAPPRYLRALVYEYHFTDIPTRRRTGAWWRREQKGPYMPVMSIQQEQGKDP